MKLKKSFNKTPRIMSINFIRSTRKKSAHTQPMSNEPVETMCSMLLQREWECFFTPTNDDDDDASKAIKTNISFHVKWIEAKIFMFHAVCVKIRRKFRFFIISKSFWWVEIQTAAFAIYSRDRGEISNLPLPSMSHLLSSNSGTYTSQVTRQWSSFNCDNYLLQP